MCARCVCVTLLPARALQLAGPSPCPFRVERSLHLAVLAGKAAASGVPVRESACTRVARQVATKCDQFTAAAPFQMPNFEALVSASSGASPRLRRCRWVCEGVIEQMRMRTTPSSSSMTGRSR